MARLRLTTDHSLGTENRGNDFPGVARPWGMVKIGPDNVKLGVNSYSGYAPGAPFSGFSLMHESGTGGAPKYGTVSQLPVIGSISNPLANLTVERALADSASVGYYRAKTVYGVIVELAATSHAGFYQYTFPNDVQCNVLIDVSHVLTSYRGNGLEQGYAGGNLTLYPDGHYEGSGTYNNGWNRAPNWTIYFCTLRPPFCSIIMTNSKQMVILMLNLSWLRYSLPLGWRIAFLSLAAQSILRVSRLVLVVCLHSVLRLPRFHLELVSLGSQLRRLVRMSTEKSQQAPLSKKSFKTQNARGTRKCLVRSLSHLTVRKTFNYYTRLSIL